ncbi:hypothetical protein FRB99_008848 [Tulasnella sp. 403]|nr:hypothetical protein FRB99_008848 [Tulasnella sp. 403]
MAPNTALAKPPFAIDDDDTQYVHHEKQPRRTREERHKVSESTYDAYDTYFDPKHSSSAQHDDVLVPPKPFASSDRPISSDSAHNAIGGGLLNSLDDSDISDDDSDAASVNKKPLSPSDPSKSKNQALFEAAVVRDMSANPKNLGLPPPAYEDVSGRGKRFVDEKGRGARTPSPEPGRGPSPNLHPQQQYGGANPATPAPSRTPPPAAPLQVHIPAHQMNAPQPQRPIPAAARVGGPQDAGMGRGPPLTIAPPPAAAFVYGPGGGPVPQTAGFGTPGFHMNPTPIPAPTSTPIQPAFIKPIKPAFIKFDEDGNEKGSSVMSHESSMPIMRGEKEDYLPLRSGRRAPPVGGKVGEGDDFWRRFSMVVKMEKSTPPEKKKSPEHAIPVAIGGGASETMDNATAIPTPIVAGTATATASKKSHASASTTPPPVSGPGIPGGKRHVGDFVLPVVAETALPKREAPKVENEGRSIEGLGNTDARLQKIRVGRSRHEHIRRRMAVPQAEARGLDDADGMLQNLSNVNAGLKRDASGGLPSLQGAELRP